MELGYTIIVEVDEHQHNTEKYKTCDIPRMINLWSDLMTPTYIIRYNPDEYKVNGKKKMPTDNKRKKTLIDWIKWTKSYGVNGKVTDGLHVIYLYYDEYDESMVKWVTIDPADKSTWV
jgi:hypothetical protein